MSHLKRFATLLIAVLVIATSLGIAAPAAAGGPTATVNSHALNVRSGPGISYSRITAIAQGTTMTLLARNSDTTWVKVLLWNGTEGWVSAGYITPTIALYNLPVDYGTTPIQATGTVVSYALNVRTGPGAWFDRITAIPRGTGVTLLARNTDTTWIKVQLFTGQQGWVNGRYLGMSVSPYTLPVDGGPTPPPPPPSQRVHVVQPGENLFRISLRYGVSMVDIATANGLTNLTLIYAGQTLVIP